MAHLSSLSQDLILLSHPYWGMLRLSDKHVSGSSIMPQKRNLDFAEVIRGKTAWTAGMVTGLLAIPKGAMSSYNRDSQITKYAALDVVRECRAAPTVLQHVIEGVTVDEKAIKARLGQGFLAAADFADMLARALDLPFRAAYGLAATAVRLSGDAGTITPDAARQALSDAGHSAAPVQTILADLSDPSRVVSWRKHTGAPAPEAVKQQIAWLRADTQRLTAFIPEQRTALDAAWKRCREWDTLDE
jgi:argininosuccinate lyase